MSDFEGLLEELVPGAGRVAATDIEAPPFPRGLGLEPLGVIGRGASGWVFRARDPVLAREVAVKISRPDQGGRAREALLQEARRSAALDHPSVLPVHRVVVSGGLVCVEYRLAPLQTLEALLADTEALATRTLVDRLALVRGPVGAVRKAHSVGLLHGDIHPGNLLLGRDDSVYLLDWAGPASTPGALSGSPTHAATEVLAGAPHSPASDVFALGAVAWELCAGRPLRPRLRGEDLGGFIARWRDRPAPRLPDAVDAPPGVASLLREALDASPERRLPMAAFVSALDAALSGAAERAGRQAQRTGLLGTAREALGRYRDLGGQLDDERTVLTIQRARVPGHAPPVAKRAMWEAEDRVEAIEAQRVMLWVNATEAAMLARTVGDEDRQAREMIAELWWARMEDMISRGQDREVKLAMHHIIQADPDRRGAALRSPCALDLLVEGRPATVRIQPLAERGRRLVAGDAPALRTPLGRQSLPAGRYLVRVEAEGCPPVHLPLRVARAAHATLRVRPRTATEIGEGFAHVPAGGFVLGGDDQARSPMPRCRPTVPDLFIQVHPVTVAEWQAFLDALPPDEAARRVPGERGVLGPELAWWSRDAEGRWRPPATWRERWPIVGIDVTDADAYARWRSSRDARLLRLPTEEEWEKAARGTDARAFPWGDRFDPTFAHMRSSQSGLPGPGPVDAFPVDTSPYGVRGMAGGVREWTASWLDAEQVVVRGGSWADEAADLRCASRRGMAARARSPMVGFRLVSEAPAG